MKSVRHARIDDTIPSELERICLKSLALRASDRYSTARDLADDVFSIGLIDGPSDCGKSSLMRAGLLPRLSADGIPVYIEATSDDTEQGLNCVHGGRFAAAMTVAELLVCTVFGDSFAR